MKELDEETLWKALIDEKGELRKPVAELTGEPPRCDSCSSLMVPAVAHNGKLKFTCPNCPTS